jgi:type I restriction enzyme S subunit
LRAAVDAGWIAALAKGIRVRSTQFDRPALASLKIAYPSIETQQRIADYLDRETAEIDAAVADLDRYVDLLEKRRTLRLVEETGIRGTSSMTMIGRHAQVALGKTLQSEQKNDNEQLVNYVRAGNIQPNGIFNGEEKQMWMTPDEQATYSILPDDVLVVEGGAGYGRSITFDHGLEGWGFQNHVIRIRPQSGWVGKFIDYSIRAHKADGLLDLLAVGATIPGFSSERVRNLPIAFLGESEQREVVHILD